MHHVGNDDRGQDGAPPTLHDDHTQNLPLGFLNQNLGARSSWKQKANFESRCPPDTWQVEIRLAHVFAVLGLGEVDEVVVVHVLGVEQVAVLLLAQVFRVDAVGAQELLVGHAEGLADGLSDQLGLEPSRVSQGRLVV